jgi:hypothetical protein
MKSSGTSAAAGGPGQRINAPSGWSPVIQTPSADRLSRSPLVILSDLTGPIRPLTKPLVDGDPPPVILSRSEESLVGRNHIMVGNQPDKEPVSEQRSEESHSSVLPKT